MIEMLVSQGANINHELLRDSRLEAATDNGYTDVVAFLKAHGASQTRGTPEQREAVSAAIVRREIERNTA